MDVVDLIVDLANRTRLAETTRTLAQHDATIQILRARELDQWKQQAEHAFQSILDELARQDYPQARAIALRMLNENGEQIAVRGDGSCRGR